MRVGTGSWSEPEDQPPEKEYLHGFLLADDGVRFRVRHLDLTDTYWRKSEPSVPRLQSIGWEPFDLRRHAEEFAATMRAKAEDDFMHKHYEGDVVTKWDAAKGTQLGFAKQSCIKVGKIEIPACQTNAMNNAPTEMKKNLPDLLKRCIDKFSGGGEQIAAGGPPPG